MRAIGIDGCKAGWVIWQVSDGVPTCQIVPEIADAVPLIQQGTALIDIPIGFSDTASPDRACDKAARRFLSPKRGSSVFPVPCREAAYANTYQQACDINVARLGKKLSKQSWFILPKVKQVDQLLNQFPNLYLRESHPEVVFAALNNRQPLDYGKKSREGYQERLAIIQAITPLEWVRALEHQIESTLVKHASPDDLVDAFVLMLAAKHPQHLSCLPEVPDKDSTGRVREIVYWQPQSQ